MCEPFVRQSRMIEVRFPAVRGNDRAAEMRSKAVERIEVTDQNYQPPPHICSILRQNPQSEHN
jgi:hypothetical protein